MCAESENADKKRKSEDEGDSQQVKKKKARTTFTGRQIFELEKQFEQKKYLSSAERAEMASLLSVTETQVRNGLNFTSIMQSSSPLGGAVVRTSDS